MSGDYDDDAISGLHAKIRALSREATALRQQRDTLREALRGLMSKHSNDDDFFAARDRAAAALAQCDAQEGV